MEAEKKSFIWGIIPEGNWIIEPTFKQLGEISHGLAPAQDAKTELFGYIDDQGQWVIPPSFANVGLYAVE